MTDKPKYRLRFFFEWSESVNFLWAGNDLAFKKFDAGPINHKIPMSDGLRKRAEELSSWYQYSLNWEYPPHPGPWRQEECDRFKIAVRVFFADLQADLGSDYELIYQQDEPDEDPDLDDYLADLQNFRRRSN